jgi:hypothetical protein
MTYHDDPNMNPRGSIRDDRSGAGMWIAGFAALAIIAGIIAYAASNGDSTVASSDRPAASPPASTTGSGASSTRPRESTIPTNPTGTAPQKDPNQPAPQAR